MSAYIRKHMTLQETFPIWRDVAAIWIADIERVTTLRDCPTIDEKGFVWMQRYKNGEDIWIGANTPCLVSLHAYQDVALTQLSLFAAST